MGSFGCPLQLEKLRPCGQLALHNHRGHGAWGCTGCLALSSCNVYEEGFGRMIVITGELALRPAQKKSLMSFACFARPRSSLRNEKQRRCGPRLGFTARGPAPLARGSSVASGACPFGKAQTESSLPKQGSCRSTRAAASILGAVRKTRPAAPSMELRP